MLAMTGFFTVLQFVPHQVAGQRAAAGAVDAEHDRLHRGVIAGLADGLDHRRRTHDLAPNRNPTGCLPVMIVPMALMTAILSAFVLRGLSSMPIIRFIMLDHAVEAAEIGVHLLLAVAHDDFDFGVVVWSREHQLDVVFIGEEIDQAEFFGVASPCTGRCR